MSESQTSFNPLFEAPPPSQVSAPPPVAVDPGRIEELRETLLARQNIHRGIAGGFVSALIGAGAWAVITVTTAFQHEVMSIGIGLIVGLAVRKYGRGISPPFGVAGALLALFGSMFGNVLSAGALIAQARGLPLIQFELRLITSPLTVARLLVTSFTIFDPIYYGVAMIAGYNLSFRRPSNEDISRMILVPGGEEKLDV